MSNEKEQLSALQDIRNIMERSSRFISLSGLSGISAGICALAGAAWAHHSINNYYKFEYATGGYCASCLKNHLIFIAACVFIAALLSAFCFTYFKTKKQGIPIWGSSSRRLLWNTLVPMLVGGIFLLRMMQLKEYTLIAPGCLLFYGLALINGSKYTIGEIKYLGYAQLLIGIANLWLPARGLYCWAFGFGVMHIIYGILMWWKYERNQSAE